MTGLWMSDQFMKLQTGQQQDHVCATSYFDNMSGFTINYYQGKKYFPPFDRASIKAHFCRMMNPPCVTCPLLNIYSTQFFGQITNRVVLYWSKITLST